MSEENTKVSVVLPVYNAGKFLAACLDSLLSQSHGDIEVIAIDDLSNDESYRILKLYKKKDPRVRVYRNKKRYGLAVCFNRAVRRAKGRFITFMSPYDYNGVYRFRKQVQYLLENPKVAAVGVQTRIINATNKRINQSTFPLEHDAIYQTMLQGKSLQFESVVLDRRNLPKDLLRFSTNAYPYIFTNVFTKILQYGKFANIDQYLYYHRDIKAKTYKTIDGLEKFATGIKLWFHWVGTTYDYRPSIRAFLLSFVNPVKGFFR